MTYPSLTVFDDPELVLKYVSTTGSRPLRVSGDERKQLATMIALGRTDQQFALTFEGPPVSIPVGRMMMRILLGKNAAVCCSAQLLRFCPSLPLDGLAIVAPSNNLRQLLSILDRVGSSSDKIPDHPGIGSWSVDSVLLVGDRPSGSWPLTAPNYPFLSTLSTGCSVWLAQHLEDAGISEGRLFWVNGYSQQGKRSPSDWISALEPRGIVALGGSARAWLDGSGIKSDYQVYHPQYWKRLYPQKTYVLARYVSRLLKG